jgi:uncharacterized membrane protein YgdD (TMEM256/DUF423 family)
MHGPAKVFLLLGCINALIGVILGAFGAHGLKLWMPPDLFTVYQTAVQYQFYHALGLLGVGLLAHQFPTQTLIKWAGWFMFAGIVIFSGSLYTLSLTSTRWLGAITPIGGASFIVSWILLIVSIVRQR